MNQGHFDLGFEYVHEKANKAYKEFGQPADNSKEEVVEFNTIFLTGRYGLSERINLSATIPILDLDVTKKNKLATAAPSADDYTRLMRGIGDILLMADMRFGSSPQALLEIGLKLPTGSIDKTDEFNQPLDPILQPGSGTTDLVVGAGFWAPHFLFHNLDLIGNLRHRFVPGQNKWGYEFGDQTMLNLHGSMPVTSSTRLGVRASGTHSGQDHWYDNAHGERGSTFLTLGPTLAWNLTEVSSLGAEVQMPLYMHLTGSQLVDTATFSLFFNTDLTETLSSLFGSNDEDDLE